MKKSLICLVALVGLALGFTSCEKESQGVTQITYFAEIVLNGDATMVVAKGSTFVDPGCTAVMKGEDVTDKVAVSSNVDTSVSGVYTITYSIVNADGFPASASRTVVVLDVTDPVEGLRLSTQVAPFLSFAMVVLGSFPAHACSPSQTVFEIMFSIKWIHILHNPAFRSIVPPFRGGNPLPSRAPTSLSQAFVCVVSWLPSFGF